jgi:hypothetical protein
VAVPAQDNDAMACQSTSTKKKVAETSLEMGKKGSKGVTAKGTWVGVDAGETAEFSHFILIPVSQSLIWYGLAGD